MLYLAKYVGIVNEWYAEKTMLTSIIRFQTLVISISFIASFSLLVPIVQAAGCGKGPVTVRTMTGKTLETLRMRSIACSTGSKALKTVPAGTSISIIGETNNWYKVKIGTTVGWMASSYIKATAVKAVSNPIPVVAAPVSLNARAVIGVTESDFEKVQAGNKTLITKLKGKVLLRVEKSGETWLVESNGSLSRVTLPKKEVAPEAPVVAKEEPTVVAGVSYQLVENELQLKAKVLPGAVQLDWTKRTSDHFQAYKVVRSLTNADLSFPGDGFIQSITDREQLSFIEGDVLQGKSYYHRICAIEDTGTVVCGNVVKAGPGYFRWK